MVVNKLPELFVRKNRDFFILDFVIFFSVSFRAAPTAFGSSQAKGRIRAVAASLHHSHSDAGSEPCPQLMTVLDPQPTE